MEPSEHDADPMSPMTQRRIWRRAWMIVVVLVLLTPVVLWIVIDQAGKAEWREVQTRLRAKGEATTVEELNLPTREQVPDAENFCAIPWLMANDDGTASAAMVDLEEKLEIFASSREEPPLLQRAAGGAAMLGYPGDSAALARLIALNAKEQGRVIDDDLLQKAVDDPLAICAAYLEEFERYWIAAEAVRDRPYAYFLPMHDKRLELAEGLAFGVSYPSFSIVRSLTKAFAIRAAVAIQHGDHEMVLRSTEICQRLGEAAGNELNLIGGLVNLTEFAVTLRTVVECLWDDSLQNDSAKLLRLQATLEAWDLNQVLAQSLRGELVQFTESMQFISSSRANVAEAFNMGQASILWWGLMPQGWWYSHAAYYADLFDRTLLEACRNGNHADLRMAAKQFNAQFNSLTERERMFRMPVVMFAPAVEKIVYAFSLGEAYRRQAIIVCALYRYRIDHGGEYAKSLDALVPAYLERVPRDTIDDAPMRYLPLSAGNPTFQLYSIGHDGVDDAGILNLDPDEPQSTKVQKLDYLGDWPWPVEPRDLSASATEEK